MFFCAAGSTTLGVIVVILVAGVLGYFVKALLERDEEKGCAAVVMLFGIFLLAGLIAKIMGK